MSKQALASFKLLNQTDSDVEAYLNIYGNLCVVAGKKYFYSAIFLLEHMLYLLVRSMGPVSWQSWIPDVSWTHPPETTGPHTEQATAS